MSGFSVISKWILALLIMVLIIFILFNPYSGYGPKVMKLLADYVNQNANLPDDEIEKKSVEKFDEGYNEIRAKMQSSDSECFISLDFDRAMQYRFVQQADGIQMSMDEKRAKDDTEVRSSLAYGTIPSARLCYIGGLNDQALLFYYKYIEPSKNPYNKPIPYSSFLSQAAEASVRKGSVTIDGNDFNYRVSYLYKADSGNMCLIPTERLLLGCRDSLGPLGGVKRYLSNSCADEIEKGIQAGNLKMCGG